MTYRLVRYDKSPPNRWQPRSNILQSIAEIDVATVIPVARNREKRLRHDLRKPIEHTGDPKIGRAARPDRPKAGSREHRNNGLRTIRQKPGNPIAGPNASRAQSRGVRRNLGAKLGERERATVTELRPR